MNGYYSNTAQRGMTLVELMVALTIGTLIMLFLVEIFAQASTNARLQRNIAWMQEDGRTALEIIAREVRLAGYRPSNTDETVVKDCPAVANWTVPAVCSIFGVNGLSNGTDSNGVAVKADGVGTAYLNDSTMMDCNGGATTGTVVTRFWLNGTTLYMNCSGSTQPILDNIERLEVVYGVAETLPAVATTRIKYLPTPSLSEWPRVISVRINLLVLSRNDKLVSDPQSYYWFDSDGKLKKLTASDKRLHQAFSTVVLLRNRLP
ncbi:prepilin-type N-terminal cleavage/methylation domain-containing protein [Plasticicumulans lactativorans]|uniref:Prepilin-type N-terminal cleavage/methylation domain-containing protein n=1 Tax=Plasticicumulans lactativorans TaxID=1133106 RepID=A0A4R2L1U8_9GAMM|nr:PilW family protein [Plasticicumulans lactativorans]TCO80273.1 prepilin-type N-terminal cleavage/methylation domain-containing protein [Plasticicumulans lactativorans]